MAESKNYIPALRYDWLTRIYDPVLQFTMPERGFKSALITQMNLQAGHKVLDFGCGTLTLSMIAAQSNPATHFFGVDIDEKILTLASAKIKNTGLAVQAQLYDGQTLPYPDNHFDRAMSSLVFHHLNERQKYAALSEIYRVLKPTGELHIADFGKPSNYAQRVGFLVVQLLDGFETTQDSVKDILPLALKQASFSEVTETTYFNTMVGTVRLLRVVKKAGSVL